MNETPIPKNTPETDPRVRSLAEHMTGSSMGGALGPQAIDLRNAEVALAWMDEQRATVPTVPECPGSDWMGRFEFDGAEDIAFSINGIGDPEKKIGYIRFDDLPVLIQFLRHNLPGLFKDEQPEPDEQPASERIDHAAEAVSVQEIDFLTDALEATARAATPGPWKVDRNTPFLVGFYHPDGKAIIEASRDGDLIVSDADAAYITTVTPDVVLVLIERLRAAEGRAWKDADDEAGIIAATKAYKSAVDAAVNLSADAEDADDMLSADYDFEQACRAYAPVAARWISEHLGVKP